MEINKKNILPSHPLVGIRFEGGDIEYSPKLSRDSEVHRLITFEEWWERDRRLKQGGWTKSIPKGDSDVEDVPLLRLEWAHARQVGWELLESCRASGVE